MGNLGRRRRKAQQKEEWQHFVGAGMEGETNPVRDLSSVEKNCTDKSPHAVGMRPNRKQIVCYCCSIKLSTLRVL